MMIKEFEILIYETIDGKMPFKDFIFSVEKNVRVNILKRIDRFKSNKDYLKMPHSKKLNHDLFEFRFIVINNYVRIIYFYNRNNGIVITNAFIKKTNKTPIKEIEKAISYKEDREKRNEEN